jgi:hypothetical protein
VNPKNIKLILPTQITLTVSVKCKGNMNIQTYVKHSMDLKFNQINSTMWNKSKIQNVQYKNIISILRAACKYIITFTVYSSVLVYSLNPSLCTGILDVPVHTDPFYNTKNKKMIKRNLYIFPYSLFLH